MLKKTAVIVIVIAVFVSCCCFTASAAEITAPVCSLFSNSITKNNTQFENSFNADKVTGDSFITVAPRNVVGGFESENGEYDWWYANYTWNAGGQSPGLMTSRLYINDYYGKINLLAGDTLKLVVSCTFYGGNLPLDAYGLILYSTDGKVIGSDVRRTLGAYEKLTDVFTIEVSIAEPCTVGRLAMAYDRTSGGNWGNNGWAFGMNGDLELVYGDPDDIAIQSQLSDLEKKQEQMIAEQEETNKKIEEMIAEQEETNNKLDEIIAQPEQEKQEAGSTGNDAIDGLTSAIPADNDGVIAAMRKLSAAMSYTGTECKWKFPALYIPAIDGVTPRIDLSGEKDINFTEWINAMPADVIEVVRIIATIALILYCFKELYNLIKYILTMKGGGGGNE